MTHIQWTDRTWNPVLGCTPVSEGCRNCYAATMAHRLHAMSVKGQNLPGYEQPLTDKRGGRAVFNGTIRLLEDRLAEPLKWRKPSMVFVNSMSDLFHERVPFGFVMRVLSVIAHTPWHTYQILTKRPERMAEFWSMWHDLSGEDLGDFKDARGPDAVRKAHPSGRGELFAQMLESMGDPPPGAAYPSFDWMHGMIGWGTSHLRNVWLGTSVEDQATADARIPHLLRCPAAVRFLSCEPLLGAVDLSADPRWLWASSGLHWLIAGGESCSSNRSAARPMHPDWACSLRDQCQAAGVPFFFKQWGEWACEFVVADQRDHCTFVVGSDPPYDPRMHGVIESNGKRGVGFACDWCYPVAQMVCLGTKHTGRLLDGIEHNAMPSPTQGGAS